MAAMVSSIAPVAVLFDIFSLVVAQSKESPALATSVVSLLSSLALVLLLLSPLDLHSKLDSHIDDISYAFYDFNLEFITDARY